MGEPVAGDLVPHSAPLAIRRTDPDDRHVAATGLPCEASVLSGGVGRRRAPIAPPSARRFWRSSQTRSSRSWTRRRRSRGSGPRQRLCGRGANTCSVSSTSRAVMTPLAIRAPRPAPAGRGRRDGSRRRHDRGVRAEAGARDQVATRPRQVATRGHVATRPPGGDPAASSHLRLPSTTTERSSARNHAWVSGDLLVVVGLASHC